MNARTATFDELVLRHQSEVQRVCCSILRDEHLGADAAQETFLRLWRRITAGESPAHSGGWLRKVAISTALDFARRRTSSAAAHETDDLRANADARADTRPQSNELEADELRQRFKAALSTLSEGQRTVFLLRHEGGLTLAAVAEALELSLPTVKTQFARACLKLQAQLAPFDPARKDLS